MLKDGQIKLAAILNHHARFCFHSLHQNNVYFSRAMTFFPRTLYGHQQASEQSAVAPKKPSPRKSDKTTHMTRNHVSSPTGKTAPQVVSDMVMPTLSPNVRSVYEHLRLWNPGYFAGAETFASASFQSRYAIFEVDDLPDLPCFIFADIIELIHASFPDGRFDYTDIYDGVVPNTVVVEGFRFTGTHTGMPYSFLPGVPALPASGKHVANDEERLYFTMGVDHKIEHVTVIAMGMHTGPAGIYEQLIGSLPNEEESPTAAC
jgi:hypothetical protein